MYYEIDIEREGELKSVLFFVHIFIVIFYCWKCHKKFIVDVIVCKQSGAICRFVKINIFFCCSFELLSGKILYYP